MAKKLNSNDDTNFRVSKNAKCFSLVKDKNNKVVIVLGGYAACKKRFDNFEQAEMYIGQKPWELIINICGIIQTRYNNEQKIENADKATKENS